MINYYLDPLLLLLIEELVSIFFLGDMEIHTHDSHEQINAENAADDNKHDKQHTDPTVIIHDRTSVLLAAVNSRVHIVRPALQGRQHKKRNHRI